MKKPAEHHHHNNDHLQQHHQHQEHDQQQESPQLQFCHIKPQDLETIICLARN
jgi:hypothetical protein